MGSGPQVPCIWREQQGCSPAGQEQCPQPCLPIALSSGSSQQVALIIYVVFLAGLKSSGHYEGRRGQSVQLGITQSLIFYMIIFHYSAVFKAKTTFFSLLFKALTYSNVSIS